MVLPVPRKLQLTVDLETLPQDVSDIKSNVSNLQDVVQKGLDPTRGGFAAEITRQFDAKTRGSVTDLLQSILTILDPQDGWVARRVDNIKLEQVIANNTEGRQQAINLSKKLLDNSIYTPKQFLIKTRKSFVDLGIREDQYNSLYKSIKDYCDIK